MRQTNQTRPRPPKPETKRTLSTAIFAVLLLAGVAFAVYKYQQSSEITEPQPAPVEASTTSTPQTTRPTSASRKREPRALKPTVQETEPAASTSEPEASAPTVASTTPELRVSSPYRCDGRTRCSQMSSCAEATFFLNNCPGTQMDGDNDGVPCEQQWCSRF